MVVRRGRGRLLTLLLVYMLLLLVDPGLGVVLGMLWMQCWRIGAERRRSMVWRRQFGMRQTAVLFYGGRMARKVG
jgi:hypothetical protein